MFALIHLIFEIIRISILSLLYGILSSFFINKTFEKKNIKKRVIIPIIFISLLVWRFSYWRNNGFGDQGYIPINSKYYLQTIDWAYISLESRNGNFSKIREVIDIKKLYLEDEILFIKNVNEYQIVNLKTETVSNKLSKKEFQLRGGITSRLISIDKFHGNYWGNWFLLLL